jgi:phytoene dehydrogenase-like protein
MSDHRDAIVIGGGIGGLVAALHLARAGRKTLLLEAEDALGGACRPAALSGVRWALKAQTLYALDPRLAAELVKRGLKFSARDMATVGLRPDGKHLVLGRDARAAARSIAPHSPQDAAAWPRYRRALFEEARALRPFWWESEAADPARLARLGHLSAEAYLAQWFESEAVRTALAADVARPSEPGSALALAWRASQEMCGLQGAVALPKGGAGALAELLTGAAREAGVEIRTKAPVKRLILTGDAVAGVALDSGEAIHARCVLSSLSRHATLLDLAPTASAGLAETLALAQAQPATPEAAVAFVLNAAPGLGGPGVPATARFILGEEAVVLEVVVPTASEPDLAPPGQHILSVRAHGFAPMPQAALVGRIVGLLEPHTTHLRERIVAMDMRMGDMDGARAERPAQTRVGTPVEGLYLCGGDAEPVSAVSGCAGRVAAAMANGRLG